MRPALAAALIAGVVAAVLLVAMLPADRSATPSRGDGTPCSLPSTGQAPRVTPKPWLIKLGQDIPTTEQFAAGCTLYESRPFDGWVVRSRNGVFTSEPVPVADYAIDLAAFPPGLTRSTHNFVRALVTEPLDFADDAQWSTIAGNAGRLAAAIRDSGRQFDGILLDNEWYGSGASPWDFGTGRSAWSGAPLSAVATAARDQARERGRQVAAAVVDAWPQATILVLYGPWVSEPETAEALSGSDYQDVSWGNELMGTFSYGIAQGTFGTPARFVDGGEVYGARTPADFAALASWQRSLLAASGTVVIPPAERRAYSGSVDVSVGVYDRDSRADFAVQPPAELTGLLRHALASADTYVWLYTEKHEWGASESSKPSVPQEYVDAVGAATG